MRAGTLRLIVAMVALSAIVSERPLGAAEGEECTTLVAAGAATSRGGPLFWKNRDTGTLSNKVLLVAEQPYSFLALVDADDSAGRAAWAGVNAAGFAIANSASYNLPQSQDEAREQDGVVMAEALRTCRTVDDLERLLERRQGKRLGVRSNFFALDAQGGAVIIETHNNGHTRYDAASFPGSRLANTNFSRSGGIDQGAGYLRFDRASELLATMAPGRLDAATILDVLSRDLSHPLLQHPPRAAWKTLPAERPYWVHSNYTIDRPSTASAVVVEGVRPGQDPRLTTMWVALGEPVTSIAVPVWIAAGAPPEELWQGKGAPISVEAARLKSALRPLKSRERSEYADLTRLDNAAGSGWLPGLMAVERQIMAETAALLETKPGNEALASFQREMAARALAALKAVEAAPRADLPVTASLAAPSIAEGAALQRSGKHEQAVSSLDRALAIDARLADAHLLRCRSLAALRRYDDALAACSLALQIQPGGAEALRDRGHYFLNAGQVDAGLSDLLEADSLSRGDRGVLYHLGLAYYLKGEFANAAAAYERCVDASTSDGAKIECKAWLLPSLLRAGRRKEARSLLAGVSKVPVSGHTSLYLDRLLLFKGARTEAELVATMPSEGPVTEATVGYSIGVWHLLNGRQAAARTYFQRSIDSKLTTSWGARASEAELRRLAAPVTNK
ncbi:MAG: tetratricopeptide repeat protein [Vicinamibacteria bacterium]